MKNFFRKRFTIQYPEERVAQHPRFRGEEFTWYQERCTGCAVCAKYCPLGIIRIVTHPGGEHVSEGQEYAIDVFDIDIGRCMFCGLCVEACPYDALHMGSGFEEGQYSRKDLVITKDRLINAEKKPSTWFRPQLENQQYNSQSGSPIDWKNAGREPWSYHKPVRPQSAEESLEQDEETR